MGRCAMPKCQQRGGIARTLGRGVKKCRNAGLAGVVLSLLTLLARG